MPSNYITYPLPHSHEHTAWYAFAGLSDESFYRFLRASEAGKTPRERGRGRDALYVCNLLKMLIARTRMVIGYGFKTKF